MRVVETSQRPIARERRCVRAAKRAYRSTSGDSRMGGVRSTSKGGNTDERWSPPWRRLAPTCAVGRSGRVSPTAGVGFRHRLGGLRSQSLLLLRCQRSRGSDRDPPGDGVREHGGRLDLLSRTGRADRVERRPSPSSCKSGLATTLGGAGTLRAAPTRCRYRCFHEWEAARVSPPRGPLEDVS